MQGDPKLGGHSLCSKTSGTGAVFSENFEYVKPGHGIHREVAPDLLKQKTKAHILKDKQEPGTAVLCNGSNWESEVGHAQ